MNLFIRRYVRLLSDVPADYQKMDCAGKITPNNG